MIQPLIRLFIAILVFFPAPTLYADEIVEGIAATVKTIGRKPIREIIFYSDIDRYRLFFQPELEKATPPIQLNAVIDQRLFRHEARRFILDGPSSEALEKQLDVIRARFENEIDFKKALNETGMNLDELKKEVREYLWVEMLLEERIKEFIFISPNAIETYYQKHAQHFEGKALEAVEKSIEATLIKEKEILKKNEYLQRLKTNAEIHIFLK